MIESRTKLAAIVFTDIAGFTALSAKNQPAALALLNTQREILKPIVEENRGKWLKEIGDGLLLTFDTSIDAVKCSIAIQKAVGAVDNLNLRIGIHQGEVVIQGDDVLGDDVNITSRLEPFSAVGGIAVSDKVNASLQRDPEFETKLVASPDMKGVSQEIKVYAVISHGLPAPSNVGSQVKLNEKKPTLLKKVIFPITGAFIVILGAAFWFLAPLITFATANQKDDYEKRIAVLYLENDGSVENAYFSDGLTEEIMSRVSRIDKISVVSRFDVAV